MPWSGHWDVMTDGPFYQRLLRTVICNDSPDRDHGKSARGRVRGETAVMQALCYWHAEKLTK